MKMKKMKYGFCFALMITLGFVACKKEVVVPENQLDQPQALPTETDQRMADFLNQLDQENYAYSSFVKVTDQSGKNYVQFKLYSNHKELYENEMNRYQNAVMRRDPSINTENWVSDTLTNTTAEENDADESEIDQDGVVKSDLVIVTVESRLDNPEKWEIHFPQVDQKIGTLWWVDFRYAYFGLTQVTAVVHIRNEGTLYTSQRLNMYWDEDVAYQEDLVHIESKPMFKQYFVNIQGYSLQGVYLMINTPGTQVDVKNWFISIGSLL